MTDQQPPLSAVHLPWFVSTEHQTDVLLIATGIFLVLFVFTIGVLLLRLHHLPEHIAGKEQKVQYQVVAVLGLLAMFTHENLFWIAGLLLAMVDLPDFTGLLGRIANSVQRISFRKGPEARRIRDVDRGLLGFRQPTKRFRLLFNLPLKERDCHYG
ncbi:hypothetical protein [Bradyrhizobium yuanmingense]|uniref:hypothetical protein n=1 Tax=Bradyrhizobium yuanmingense TaxID=108015 RepID=UPI001CD3B749|nr:hypothetical protein [Bradyrhizobium yuanmingense]MCA1526528.1 hypothetical protein [Bradyrhizobium yuanmingense]